MIRSRRMIKVFVPLCGLLAAAAAGGAAWRPAAADVKVTVAQLVADYLADERAADEKYRFKTVEVTGVLMGLDRSDPEVPAAILVKQLGSKESPCACQGGADLEREVARLPPGGPITVRGKLAGLVMMKMVLLGCEVVR